MPRLRIRDSGSTLRTITRVRVRDPGGVSRLIRRIRVRDASHVLRTVYEAFDAVASPDTVTGYSNTGAAANITTGSTAAAPSGGTAPFTYAWVQIGVTADVWTIGSAASSSTNFTVAALGAGATSNALFQVTITDATGARAQAFVEAIANNGQPYEPPSRFLRGGELAI